MRSMKFETVRIQKFCYHGNVTLRLPFSIMDTFHNPRSVRINGPKTFGVTCFKRYGLAWAWGRDAAQGSHIWLNVLFVEYDHMHGTTNTMLDGKQRNEKKGY